MCICGVHALVCRCDTSVYKCVFVCVRMSHVHVCGVHMVRACLWVCMCVYDVCTCISMCTLCVLCTCEWCEYAVCLGAWVFRVVHACAYGVCSGACGVHIVLEHVSVCVVHVQLSAITMSPSLG